MSVSKNIQEKNSKKGMKKKAKTKRPPQKKAQKNVFHNIAKYVLLSVVFVVLVVAIFCGVQWFSDSMGNLLIHDKNVLPASLQTSVDDNVQASVVAPTPPVAENMLPLRNWLVPDLILNAEAGISVQVNPAPALPPANSVAAPEANSASTPAANSTPLSPVKVLFQKNQTVKLPIASLTKLMTALVVLENYDLSRNVTVDANAMAQEGDQGGLQLGQVFTVKSLLYTALMESNNRAAYQLSEVMGTNKFIASMNAQAAQLGLTNTHFADTTGLDSGSYSTAQDLAKLTRYLYENFPLFGQIIGLKEYDLYTAGGTFHHTMENTNELLGTDDVIGGKTGFTDDAHGCLMTLQDSPALNSGADGATKNYLISIVLGSNDRFAEMQNIITWVNSAYQWQP